jgi:hypothetical protein
VIAFRSIAALSGALLAACAAPVDGTSDATAAGCTMQVIVSLATPVEGEPDAALVDDLERVGRLRLAYLRSVTAGMHVFELSADDADPDCVGALDRLRADPRIRSVEPDRRRRPQG